ncbi:MAG: 2-isopropylmalate synthase [Frankia sp.]
MNESIWQGDLVRESARAGRLVIFEEAPRDGAQGKTLMDADTRIAIANIQGAMFGDDGPRHVLFTAGFPSAAKEEFEITRRVALEAEGVSVTCVCRGTPRDIDAAIAAMRGAPHGRLMYFVPGSEATARHLVRKTAAESVDYSIEMAKYALDRADGLAIDMAFADASRADRELMIDAVSRLTAEGVASVQLADTVGYLLPTEVFELYSDVISRADEEAVVVAHLHNDLGVGLVNSLEAIRAGSRVVASSWLGLGERSGMTTTEQLTFLLAHNPERLEAAIGKLENPLWWTQPDLRQIPVLAKLVSEATDTPLKITDPIVGSGVSTISTGTPFVDRATFQPYDPVSLLGLEPRVVLTQLASDRVVREAANDLNIPLTDEQVHVATQWVKSEAFRRGKAVIPDEDFRLFATGMIAQAG